MFIGCVMELEDIADLESVASQRKGSSPFTPTSFQGVAQLVE